MSVNGDYFAPRADLATREHLVREADRIDPRVDTATQEYAPTDPDPDVPPPSRT